MAFLLFLLTSKSFRPTKGSDTPRSERIKAAVIG